MRYTLCSGEDLTSTLWQVSIIGVVWSHTQALRLGIWSCDSFFSHAQDCYTHYCCIDENVPKSTPLLRHSSSISYPTFTTTQKPSIFVIRTHTAVHSSFPSSTPQDIKDVNSELINNFKMSLVKLFAWRKIHAKLKICMKSFKLISTATKLFNNNSHYIIIMFFFSTCRQSKDLANYSCCCSLTLLYHHNCCANYSIQLLPKTWEKTLRCLASFHVHIQLPSVTSIISSFFAFWKKTISTIYFPHMYCILT